MHEAFLIGSAGSYKSVHGLLRHEQTRKLSYCRTREVRRVVRLAEIRIHQDVSCSGGHMDHVSLVGGPRRPTAIAVSSQFHEWEPRSLLFW